jgi:hypothetical protein
LELKSKKAERKSSPAWKYDWDPVRWVYLETTLKSRPAYIGFCDDDDSLTIYLHFTRIRDSKGNWLDYDTWIEKYGALPGPGYPFGCTAVSKGTITKIQEIEETFPGSTGRCWVCGKQISKGKFCGPEHEGLWRFIGYDMEVFEPE